MARYYKPSPMDRVNVERGRGSPGGRNRGSGKLAGTNNAKYKYNLAKQNAKGNQSGFNLPLGSLLGGRGGNNVEYAQQDYDRQLAFFPIAFFRSRSFLYLTSNSLL